MQDIRKSSEYQRWKREVRQRDGNACRVCGVQLNLHIHHIKPLERYPDFATELDNGITLCGNHHALLTGREESTNLQMIIEVVSGQHDRRTADQLRRLSGKFCAYLDSLLKSNERFTRNKGVHQLFTHLQIYPDSLDQFLPLIQHLLYDENSSDEELAKQIVVDFLKGSSSRIASQILSEYERQAEAEIQREEVEKRRCIVTKQPIDTFSHEVGISSVAYSPTGDMIASGEDDGTVKLWSTKTGQEIVTFKGHGERVYSVAFSPVGDAIASGADDGTVKLWSIEAEREIITFEKPRGRVGWTGFSPTGDTIALVAGGTGKLWSIKTRQEIATFEGYRYGAWPVAFSPTEDMIASGEEDGTIKLWSIKTRQEIATFYGHESRINCVTYSPTGDMLTSGAMDGTIKLWSIEAGEEMATFYGHEGWIWWVEFLPTGDMIASRSEGTIKLWSIKTGQEIATFKGYDDLAWAVTISPTGGDMIAWGTMDYTVKLWSIETRQELATFEKHKGWICSIAYSPTGDMLASGAMDGTIKLWDISPWSTTTKRRNIPASEQMQFKDLF